MKRGFFIILTLLMPLCAISALAAQPLSIRNQSGQEIINILATPQKGEDFFMRLDLAPGQEDKVENPDCVAALRADTGLEFWLFPPVDLKTARELVFCAEHPACMILLHKQDGNAEHISGKTTSLVPDPGLKPVCELGSFHPAMPMKDVCAILPADAPVDDNGSLLAGLGFGGLAWAGRLARSGDGNDTLEHLELRRPLAEADVGQVLGLLFRQGYVPWMAEFPGLDIDFADMPKLDEAAREKFLRDAVARFLQDRAPGSAKNKPGGEARILMAPASLLPALANADAPGRDVQIFTIVLQPETGTLLLDVAAYEGETDSGPAPAKSPEAKPEAGP